MKKYDPDIRYFGPQGEKGLYELIPTHPPLCTELEEPYNREAFGHDNWYEGEKLSGFWGMIENIITRRKGDVIFKKGLLKQNKIIKDRQRRKIANKFAEITYSAVRIGGWKYFRTGEKAVTSGKVKLVPID